jgi:thiol:disulfide interchange protein
MISIVRCLGYASGALLLLAGAVGSEAVQAVTWEKDANRARHEAAATGKPLLVDFYAPWCPQCRELKERTFVDARVSALLKKVVCLRLDVDSKPPLAKQLKVSGLPRVLLLPANGGKPLMDLQGFRSAQAFEQELRRALRTAPRKENRAGAESKANRGVPVSAKPPGGT